MSDNPTDTLLGGGSSGDDGSQNDSSAPLSGGDDGGTNSLLGGGDTGQGETGSDTPKSTEWFAQLSDQWRDHPNMQKFKNASVDTLAESLLHAQQRVSAKGVCIPGEDCTDEERAEFYSALGRPEKYEDYEFSAPDSGEVDKELVDAMGPKMHELGLSNEQVKGISAAWNDYVGELNKTFDAQQQEQRENAEKVLKGEWGPSLQANLNLAHKALTTFAADEAEARDIDALVGDNPTMIRFLYRLARATSEDNASETGGETSPVGHIEDIQSAINKVRNDPKHLFNVQNHPNHKQAVKEMEKLYAHLYG